MCGIAGIIGNVSPDRVPFVLERMVSAQAHRGPDDEGICVVPSQGGWVGLGHRRLAIIDLSALGHQPMKNPDTGDLIVYNGEIYNFKDLRAELRAEGIGFRSESDTELILRAYEVWGRACLDRFRGMFAFGLWDARAESLLLARDHFGIKPLYYTVAPDAPFLFASEVNALVASGLLSCEIDRRALAGYLAYGSVQAPLTIFEGVRSLEAAHWMEVDGYGHVQARRRYWQLPSPHEEAAHSSRSLVDEARSLLSASVSRHLVSDVPVGVFLSSGLDSTAVLGLVNGNAPAATKSFTVSFAEAPEQDEGDIAAETARRFHVEHQNCAVSSATVLDWVLKSLEVMDQPSMDGLNTYIVSRAVHEQGIIVALSGQGGDEMFGGYPSFREVPALYRMLRWAQFIPPDLRVMASRVATHGKNEARRKKAVDMARSGANLLDLYFHRRRACADTQMATLGFEAEELSLTKNFQLPEADGSDCLVPGDPVASITRLETKYYLGNTLLRDGDVFGMANSLEVRVPMLDRDVAEWIFKLPGSAIVPQGKPGKYLLRRACADLYSERIMRQHKHGFVIPIAKWMGGPLHEVVESGIEAVERAGLVRSEGVHNLMSAFTREPESPIWSRIWTLVVLGHWLRRKPAAGDVAYASALTLGN
jgi:asparagine synthase (glutamine-hydrolysing)